jgi:hypothetical protein
MPIATLAAWGIIALELSFKRAARRPQSAPGASATAAADDDQPSPRIRQAYRLARHGSSARAVAEACDLPQALAELIVDDARRTAWHWNVGDLHRRYRR